MPTFQVIPMAAFFNTLNQDLKDFIQQQQMFFIATAMADGRINLSPKGLDTFRILHDNRVAYLDLTGSGNETATHLQHDGRATIMFCSFDKRPLILRLYGKGKSMQPDHPEWADLIGQFDEITGQRQIIVLDIESVQTSCGYAVPTYEFSGQRDTLIKWAENKGEDGLRGYHEQKNRNSIDGFSAPPLHTD
jgi:hypothetical protein